MSNLSLSLDEVEENLRCNLPTIPFPRRPVSSEDVIEELTLEHVASLLEACPDTKPWSQKPRIYCLLRLIGYKGHELVWSVLQSEDYDDLCFPFSAANVPSELISDADACKHFLELQPIVRTRPDFMTFDGLLAPPHRNTLHGDLHFTATRQLTQSSSSRLDIVRNKHSGFTYLRKTVPRGTEVRDCKSRVKVFRDDISALRRLSHHHIARYVGSYTDQMSYAMILEPMAEYTLRAMLSPKDSLPVSESDMCHLPEYFGCLAVSTAFLHANGIHRNHIRPENILIHNGRIILYDFGISKDRAPSGRASISDSNGATMLPYEAPEITPDCARENPSDVWSLGMCFIEMITVLSGRLVKDLDNFLRISSTKTRTKETFGRSTIDRLNDWLEEIHTNGELAELSTLATQMIRRDPQKRPSAAVVSASIMNSLPHLACSSCARSDIPGLPPTDTHLALDRREGLAPASAAATKSIALDGKRRSGITRSGRSWSLQDPRPILQGLEQLRISHSNSDNNSTSSYRRSSLNYSAASDRLTRHDSGASSNSQTWHIRPDEELEFETTLLGYQIERGEATYMCKENGIRDGALKLILYRTKCEQAWAVTRRIVIIDPETETQTTTIFSNWLPFADIYLQLCDDTVVMSWSDCNHDVREPTRNYVETHSKRYDATKHNNTLALKVASSATVNAISLVQALCSPLGIAGRTVRQPDRQVKLMSGERVGFFKNPRDEQDDMMMIVGDLTQGATTKIYSIPSHIDLTVAMRTDQAATKQLYQAVVTGLLTNSYDSDAQHLSKMMNKKGCFRKAVQISRKAVFTFAESKALFDFLEAVTGWSLLFLARLKSVKEKRKLTHDCGAADMLLWQRKASATHGLQSLAMTFRLHRDDPNVRWISGLLPSDECIIKKLDGVEATVQLQRTSEGDIVERQELRAVSTKKNKAINDGTSKAASSEQTSRFKLVFNTIQDLAEFQHIINEGSKGGISPKTSVTTGRSRSDSGKS